VQFSLAGQVSGESAALAASRVEIVSGTNAGAATTTNAEGRYHFEGLTAGQFVMRASADGYQPQTAGVTLDAHTTRDFTLPREDDRVTLSGVVTDADALETDASAPASATVTIASGVNAGRTVAAGEQGQYAIADLALDPDEVTVEASAPGYVTASMRLRLSTEQTADFALSRRTDPPPDAVSLAGVVRAAGPTPLPVASARVSVSSGPQAGHHATTDEQGRYRIDGLSPDPLTLEVSAAGFVTETRSLTPETGQTADFVLAAAPPAPATLGRVLDVLSEVALPAVAISGEGITAQLSEPDGTFRLTATPGTSAARLVTFTSADVVERRTWLHVPDEQEAVVSLIPRSFNQPAFDEMLRTPTLRRWMATPPLVIERRALAFTAVDMTEAVAAESTMSDEEAESLLADLIWALPQLTGGRITDFDVVAWQTAEPDATVHLLNPGVITVVRVAGLADATGAWGWSRWLFSSNGVVVGGLIMLDDAFERSGSPYRRSLRSHELGHALGYAHVSATGSVMNADGRVEPTPFDLDATRIAFSRPPGNRAPDSDPEPAQAVQRAIPPTWSAPVQ
jgi:hypothetical protein